MKSAINLDMDSILYSIGENAMESAGKHLSKYSKRYLLVDENTEKYCLPVFKEKLPDISINGVLQIPSGEENKNINQCINLWEMLTQQLAERDSILINLGGGVVTDIGGFVAATYKRGMDFVNIPTTLLGQIDAAIGGKTGVDFMNFKNLVGLFTDPKAVIIDPVFLKTVEDAYWQSGFAELLKYGLILDHDLWDMIDGRFYKSIPQDNWNQLIVKAAKDKIDIVRYDSNERGIRRILNFGHTVGHAIESYYLKNKKAITHGQAVAAGMICESWISTRMADLNCNSQENIVETIDRSFGRLDFREENIPELLQLMKQDKKVRNGKAKFSLLRRLGKAVHDVELEDNVVVQSLLFYIHKKN